MTTEHIHALPGGHLIAKGITDLKAREQTVESLLVCIAYAQLKAAGLALAPKLDLARDTELALYEQLRNQSGNEDAYPRQNALLRLLSSFCRALHIR
jgi:hypothetical protein